MNKIGFACLAALLSLVSLQPTSAQDLIVSNARIIVGNGEVLGNGSVVVRRGRIARVSEESPAESGLPVLDAGGLTLMPGFIDAHRQVIQGDPEQWMQQPAQRMREYLEAGFTTVLSAGDPVQRILELRDQLDSGELQGPRLLVSAPVPIVRDAGDPIAQDDIRQAVQSLAMTGADAIASAVRATPQGHERTAFSTARHEADQQGLLAITHVRSVQDALAAVAGGSGYLTSPPHLGQFDEATALQIVQSGRSNAEHGLVMTSTPGVVVPTFADRIAHAEIVTDSDNVPRLSDLTPYPLSTLPSVAQGALNARMLRDAGIIYGFGTGTSLRPRDALRHELIPLRLVFSNHDIVDILTRSAAFAVRRDDALGTLESGKIADIVIMDGDSLTNIEHLSNDRVVIRTGQIVVDNR